MDVSKVWTGIWRKLSAPRGPGAGLEEIPGCGEALCWHYGGSIWLPLLLLKKNDSSNLCRYAEFSRSPSCSFLFPQSSCWSHKVLLSVYAVVMACLGFCGTQCKFAHKLAKFVFFFASWCADATWSCMILLQSHLQKKMKRYQSCLLLRKRNWGRSRGRLKPELRK